MENEAPVCPGGCWVEWVWTGELFFFIEAGTHVWCSRWHARGECMHSLTYEYIAFHVSTKHHDVLELEYSCAHRET